MSCHVMSYYIMSFYLMSYHTILCFYLAKAPWSPIGEANQWSSSNQSTSKGYIIKLSLGKPGRPLEAPETLNPYEIHSKSTKNHVKSI